MSNSPEEEEQQLKQGSEKSETLSPQLPKNKVQAVLQELEIMAMQKGSRNSLDISKLDKEQIDKLLESISENEKNAFAFHTKRIDAIKEIELKRIDASVINQKNIQGCSYWKFIGYYAHFNDINLIFQGTLFHTMVNFFNWNTWRVWAK